MPESEMQDVCLRLAKQIHRWRQVSSDEIVEIADEYARLWEGQIPTDRISECYTKWAQTQGKNGKVFKPEFLLKTWEGMQEKPEKEKRRPLTQYRDGQVFHSCSICQDIGWIMVWEWGHTYPDGYRINKGWHKAARPCCCEAINFVQRQPPFDTEEWKRNAINGEWARRSDLANHGTPSRYWENVTASAKPFDVEAAKKQIEAQKAMPQLSAAEQARIFDDEGVPF